MSLRPSPSVNLSLCFIYIYIFFFLKKMVFFHQFLSKEVLIYLTFKMWDSKVHFKSHDKFLPEIYRLGYFASLTGLLEISFYFIAQANKKEMGGRRGGGGRKEEAVRNFLYGYYTRDQKLIKIRVSAIITQLLMKF